MQNIQAARPRARGLTDPPLAYSTTASCSMLMDNLTISPRPFSDTITTSDCSDYSALQTPQTLIIVDRHPGTFRRTGQRATAQERGYPYYMTPETPPVINHPEFMESGNFQIRGYPNIGHPTTSQARRNPDTSPPATHHTQQSSG